MECLMTEGSMRFRNGSLEMEGSGREGSRMDGSVMESSMMEV